jgi:uncharacterized protein YeaO (DUF488 family)
MPPISALDPADVACDDLVAVARDLDVLSSHWLHTGSIYDAVPASTYSVLVMPTRPDQTRRHNAYHAWWPALAPSDSLYAAYRTQLIAWQTFAQAYVGEPERQRAALLEMIASRLLSLPARYSGVTFLGFRHAPGDDETLVRCPRRVLLSWLVGAADPTARWLGEEASVADNIGKERTCTTSGLTRRPGLSTCG